MDITVVEESNLQRWDESLSTFSAAPFISAAWLEAFRTSTHIPIYFRCVFEKQTIAMIAGLILEPSHPLGRKVDRRLFFFSGPAAVQSDLNTIMTNLLHYAALHGYTSLDLKSWDYPCEVDLMPLPYKESREEYIVDLSGPFSEVQKKIRTMIKRKVKKAQKNGLTFHESHNPDLAVTLISLLEETKSTRLTKGYEDYSYYYMPYINEDVIRKLLLNKCAKICYIKRENNILCAQLIVFSTQRAYYLLGGTNQEGYELGANALVLFHEIENLAHNGYDAFNLGGVANDSGASGLAFFKESFGAKKHACTSGTSTYLQGPLRNLAYQVFYNKLPSRIIKKLFGR